MHDISEPRALTMRARSSVICGRASDMRSIAGELESCLAERYRIECELGHGSMSTVFLAQDLKHGRPVAVKVLHLDFAETLDKEQFLHEINVVAHLRHPHILPLHDSSALGGILYFVMPYLEEGSLRARLDRKEPLPAHMALQLVREVADALDYAHRHGVIHRDIKPENILLEDDHAIVADFGIACAIGAFSADTSTEPGFVVGTPRYMSPEQACGDSNIDQRSDIYSLGCVLFELLTGRPPFSGSSTVDQLVQRLTGEAPRLSTVMGEVPSAIEEVVGRALAREPSDRFPSAKVFAQALGGSAWGAAREMNTPATAPQSSRCTSLAVLPFVNLSQDRENEYFSDAITEELIKACVKIQGLKVASRTSAFAFKGMSIDVREISRQLNVGAVLEGTVRKTRNTFRVTAQLISAKDGCHLWSETYDRELIELFDVQEELAQAIARALSVTLVGKATQLVRPNTENLSAYHFYLKGRFFLNKRTPDAMRRGIVCFEQAIQADPEYALAYSGLADSYHMLAIYCALQPREAYPTAKIAATTALALNDTLPETHVSVGYVALAYDWDWAKAEREFRRAIQLDPCHAQAFQWLGWSLLARGGPQAAIMAATPARHAMELEPLAPVIHARCGHILTYAGLPEEGVTASLRALELDPQCAVALETLAYAYCHPTLRRYTDAIAALNQALSICGSTAKFMLPAAYALNGENVQAVRLLGDLALDAENGRYPPGITTMWVSWAYATLGDKDEAFRWLELAYADRVFTVALLRSECAFDSLRSDPRFAALSQKMGFDADGPITKWQRAP
jgi:eukaryotic-like serine/threonine-protein kinase